MVEREPGETADSPGGFGGGGEYTAFHMGSRFSDQVYVKMFLIVSILNILEWTGSVVVGWA